MISELIANKRAPRYISYTLLLLVFGYSFFYALSADLTIIYDSRKTAGDWINRSVTKGARIEVYSTRIFLPRYLEGYDVHQAEFQSDDYLRGLKKRSPDYLIVTEKEYRSNSDQVEEHRFQKASRKHQSLKVLLSGDAGYQLQAVFKFKLHDWFYPDHFFGQNPRILVFKRL